MLCTAASRLRRAVSLIAPRRPRSSALRALPGASDYYVPVLGTECIEWLARDEGACSWTALWEAAATLVYYWRGWSKGESSTTRLKVTKTKTNRSRRPEYMPATSLQKA